MAAILRSWSRWPGVTNQSGQDEAQVGVNGNVAYSINGGRTEYNNWELDGGDNLDNGSQHQHERLSQPGSHRGSEGPDFELRRPIRPQRFRYGRGRDQVGEQDVSTATRTNSCETKPSTPTITSTPATAVPEYKKHDFGYTIGGPIDIPGLYNKNETRHFSSGRRNGAARANPAATNATRVPSQRSNGAATSATFVLPPARPTTHRSPKLPQLSGHQSRQRQSSDASGFLPELVSELQSPDRHCERR